MRCRLALKMIHSTPDRTGLSSGTNDVRLNVLEEFGSQPNVMNLLLISVIATAKLFSFPCLNHWVGNVCYFVFVSRISERLLI